MIYSNEGLGGVLMNHRLLIAVALVAATLAAVGLLGADYPLARWIHGSAIENLGMF